MLKTTLNKENAIVTLHPDGALSKDDFTQAAEVIDTYLEQGNKLKGVIIYTKDFPGWESFASLISHLKFVKEHQKKVTHLAFVTDSIIGEFAEKIVRHFVDPEVKTFSFDQLEKAQQWILEN